MLNILHTSGFAGLYPTIPHYPGLKPLRKALEKSESKQISIDLIKLAIVFINLCFRIIILNLMLKLNKDFRNCYDN